MVKSLLVHTDMKRKRTGLGDDHGERKRRRVDVMTPFSSNLSLAHICMLHRFIFDCSFCICLQKEIVLQQQSCDFCSSSSRTLQDNANGKWTLSSEHDMVKDLMTRYCNIVGDRSDCYKVDAMLQELMGPCGAKSIHMDEMLTDSGDRYIQFIVSGLKHLSWFLIQILVISGPFSDMSLDMVSKEMILKCKSHKIVDEKVQEKHPLSDLISQMKKNILLVCRQTELTSCIQQKIK